MDRLNQYTHDPYDTTLGRNMNHIYANQNQYLNQYKYIPGSPRVNLMYVDAAGTGNDISKYWNRAFGHVALDVEEKTYNFDDSGINILDTSHYIESVRNRDKRKSLPQDVYAYPVDLDDQEINILRNELKVYRGDYHGINNNCAHYTINALENATKHSNKPIKRNGFAAGLGLSFNHISPSDFLDSTKNSGRISKPNKALPIYSMFDEQPYQPSAWNWGFK